MKKIKIILSIILALLSFDCAKAGYCIACAYSKFDSVADCYVCYAVPFVNTGRTIDMPTRGDVTKTIVEYLEIDIARENEKTLRFEPFDTLKNLGVFDQSVDSFRLDCSKWTSGAYMITFRMNVETDTTAPFGCFPLENCSHVVIKDYVKPIQETGLFVPCSQQQLFELSSSIAQNNLVVELASGLSLAHGYIYNVLGQIQSSFDLVSSQDIDVSYLPVGFYILNVQTNKGQQSMWFRVQR